MTGAMKLPDASETLRAQSELADHVRRTPTVDVEAGALASVPVTLKLEMLQVTGTFKPRGAFALLLAADVPEVGVAGASGGNFGLALAHAAGTLGHRANVFVPATSPGEKIDGLRRLGAEVTVVDGWYADALAECEDFVRRTGALRTHAYDLPGNVIGAATLGAELEDQIGVPDTLVVAVGGGGLIAGLASWFRDRCRIIAVESEGCPTLHAALDAGAPVEVEVGGLAASSLGARTIGQHCWTARHWIDDSVLVDDAAIAEAQHALWTATRLATEPGGATALAALRSGDAAPTGRTVVIACGANVDPSTLSGTGPD